MKVTICGVRGSVAAPGADFAAVGGNTSCVAIAHACEVPTLVLDAGTGIRNVTPLLDGSAFRGTIMLSHLHWDHTIGLPFFSAGDRPEAHVRLLLPEQGVTAGRLLTRMMSPPYFPITPCELRGDWTFESLPEGTHDIEGFVVEAHHIPHKGGRTFGYRITGRSGATFAYLSDHAPIALGPGPEGWGEYHAAALALAQDADVLVHDAQYTCDELPGRATWGHSAAEYAAGLAVRAGAKRVLLFHHDPSRTDEAVAALLRSVRRRFPGVDVDVAIEGMAIEL